VSQHDFGVEQTAAILRTYMPDLHKINIVGILVSKTQPFSDKLSPELMKKIEHIKKEVVDKILEVASS